MVLFHSVGADYLAVTLAGVCVVCLPYLVVWGGREGRRIARALVLSLGGLGVLSLAYAWHIYHLGNVLSKHASTRSTVALDVGSQSVLEPATCCPGSARPSSGWACSASPCWPPPRCGSCVSPARWRPR